MTHSTEGFVLYGFSACPYCARVQHAVDHLGLFIEWQDTAADPEARQALVEATGNPQVPTLRISGDGEDRWMKESEDIVDLLYARFGDGRSKPMGLRLERFAMPVLWGLLLLGGVLGGTAQAVLWTIACVLAAIRSLNNARRTGSIIQYAIFALFSVGAVSVVADAVFAVTIAWWYLAFALVIALAFGALVQWFSRRAKQD